MYRATNACHARVFSHVDRSCHLPIGFYLVGTEGLSFHSFVPVVTGEFCFNSMNSTPAYLSVIPHLYSPPKSLCSSADSRLIIDVSPEERKLHSQTYSPTELEVVLMCLEDLPDDISEYIYYFSLFNPSVTAVAHKISWSFCQKCRRQVTAQHTCTLGIWLYMKWCDMVHGCMAYTEQHQFHKAPCSHVTTKQHCKSTISVNIQNVL